MPPGCGVVRCMAPDLKMMSRSFVSLITLRLLPYYLQVGLDLRGRFMQGFA